MAAINVLVIAEINFEIYLEGCIRRAFTMRPVRAELSNYQENSCRTIYPSCASP